MLSLTAGLYLLQTQGGKRIRVILDTGFGVVPIGELPGKLKHSMLRHFLYNTHALSVMMDVINDLLCSIKIFPQCIAMSNL